MKGSMSDQEKNNLETIEFLLDSEDLQALKGQLPDMHPADIAEAVERIGHDDQIRVFSVLDPQLAGEVLAELDGPVLQQVVTDFSEDQLVTVIGSLDSDDATDIIGYLDEDLARRILRAMPWKEFREVETLLRHDEDTAGGIMALEIVAVEETRTAEQAMEALRHKSDEVEDVYNIYVIDKLGVLKGVVTLKELVLADPVARLTDIMDTEPITVSEDQDQEEVANIFTKYDLVAAPVVNLKGILVGRITVDDVLHVVEEEASEDMTKMAGITDDELFEKSVFKLSSVRLPWLVFAFGGQMIAAYILGKFEVTINEIVMAVFFIPLVMAMGGNIGIQSATVLIRGLSIGDIRMRDSGRRILTEGAVGLINGFVISILLAGGVILFTDHDRFGLIVGIALVAVLLNAALLGTLIPLFLKRIGVDPAVATGPFITTMNDILGLLIYFGIITSASMWIRSLPQ